MARSKITVQQLAAEAEADVDEVLLTLWDKGIDVSGPTSVIPKRHTNKARRSVGMATRREMASLAFWKASLGANDAEFSSLLQQLAIPPVIQGRLTKKNINRLRAEIRGRGLDIAKEPEDYEVASIHIEPFVERDIGKSKEWRYLKYATVMAIHHQLVEDFANDDDPIDPQGARENGRLLESAMLRPQTSLGEVRKYPSVEMAGAALMHSLVHNHPFHNGNKRTALVTTLVFLDQNGLLLTCTEEELFKFILKVAQHSLFPSRSVDMLPDREVQEIAQWIRTNSRVIESGERPIPFQRMERILSRYGCTVDVKKGSNAEITRTVEASKSLFSRRNSRTLFTKIAYAGAGREVAKETIAKVRRDLELDDQHGYDSASFYDNAPECADGFIAKYRKILGRLARL